MCNFYKINFRNSFLINFLFAFLLFCINADAQVITVQTTNPGVANCIPFGGNTQFGFTGFIYRNIPAFNLSTGNKIRFDLGRVNDVNVQRNIYIAAANKNPNAWNGTSQNVSPINWVQIVPDSQIPLNPKGNTIIGDFELTYTVTNSFNFAGGGLFIAFGAAPPGSFIDNGWLMLATPV